MCGEPGLRDSTLGGLDIERSRHRPSNALGSQDLCAHVHMLGVSCTQTREHTLCTPVLDRGRVLGPRPAIWALQ